MSLGAKVERRPSIASLPAAEHRQLTGHCATEFCKMPEIQALSAHSSRGPFIYFMPGVLRPT